MTVVPFGDAEARRRIREDLGQTFFVEAAAGTGKTTALFGRLLALVRQGEAKLDSIVAVTFTEKAAGEMKLRLRSEIETALGEAERGGAEYQRLEEALAQLETANIDTFHAFCAEILRAKPIEAGIDPLFEVVPEDASKALFDRAFSDWFQQTLENPGEGVRRILRRRRFRGAAESPREALRDGAAKVIENRDQIKPWKRPSYDRTTEIDAVFGQLQHVAAYVEHAIDESHWLVKSLRAIARFVNEIELREAAVGAATPSTR